MHQKVLGNSATPERVPRNLRMLINLKYTNMSSVDIS